LKSLPNEIFIRIFSHADMQAKDLRSICLTSRHFHSVVTTHSLVIVQALFPHASETEKIILFNLAAKRTDWSPLSWLAAGERMNAAIDRVLLHLERAKFLQDEFHIFKEGTTADEDPEHARRVLRSILLAAQMIAMQGQWHHRVDYVVGTPPDLVTSLARHLEALVGSFVCSGYLFIRDLDALMSGTADIHQNPTMDGLYTSIVMVVVEEVLTSGPSFLLQLLERKQRFPTVKDFTEWIYRLCKNREWRQYMYSYHNVVVNQFNGLALWIERRHFARWRGQTDDLGLKHCWKLDLSQWAAAFPDEETWAAAMLQLGWNGPEKSVRKLLRLPSQA
jgi:F-box-like